MILFYARQHNAIARTCYRPPVRLSVCPSDGGIIEQESPADAVKPTRRKSMQKLLQFDVFRFISPNSISPNFKV